MIPGMYFLLSWVFELQWSKDTTKLQVSSILDATSSNQPQKFLHLNENRIKNLNQNKLTILKDN